MRSTLTRGGFAQRLEAGVLVADGAMGTLLVSRGLPPEHPKGLAVLEMPSLVREIHEDYLSAGAAILRTNTFDANRPRLAAVGREADLDEANRAAVRLAREAVAGEYALVAGVIGPLGVLVRPYGRLTVSDIRTLFREQATILLEEGVDLLFLESLGSLLEAEAAVGAVRDLSSDVPVVAMATFGADGRTRFGDTPAELFVALARAGADLVGANCTLGPEETREVIARGAATAPVGLAACPNAGYPTVVGGRSLFLSSPEYVAASAAPFAALGVTLLGGCCGTTPEHVRALAATAKGLRPASRGAVSAVVVEPTADEPVVAAAPPARPSALRDRLGRSFVATVEIEPPRGAAPGPVLEIARRMIAAGADALTVPDNPNARLRMSPVAFAHLLEQEVGAEAIVHVTCRNRNLLGLQSELLGAAGLGLRAVLALTGDAASSGDYPQATSVRDVDALGLVRILRGLNEGRDLSRGALGGATDFLVGAQLRCAAADPDVENERANGKIEAGAAFFVTAPVFDLAACLPFLGRRKAAGVPVLATVMPLRNARQAVFFANEVPDYAVPAPIVDRMVAAAKRGPDAEGTEALAIAVELARELAAVADGLHVVPNLRWETVAPILETARRTAASRSSR